MIIETPPAIAKDARQPRGFSPEAGARTFLSAASWEALMIIETPRPVARAEVAADRNVRAPLGCGFAALRSLRFHCHSSYFCHPSFCLIPSLRVFAHRSASCQFVEFVSLPSQSLHPSLLTAVPTTVIFTSKSTEISLYFTF
jgi:hypothetical protein